MRITNGLLLVGGTLVSIAALSGCASTQPPAAGSAPSQASEDPPAASTSPAPAPAVTAETSTRSSASPRADAARTDPNAPAGQCADRHLEVSVQNDPTGSGAGQRLSYVVFRNTGPSDCVLRGAPGVSLVGSGDGTQVGAAAARSTDGTVVTIRPGSFALAPLSSPNIDENGGAYGDGDGNDPQCQAKPVDGYRVYPPHSYRASFTRVPNLYGCSTQLQTLRVSAVAPASEYPDFEPRF